MKTTIMLSGLSLEPVEFIEIFQGTRNELKTRLLSLQKGYCENEKPKTRIIKSKEITLLEAYSTGDYSHVARIF
jgi:hypothetical protein